ncbi:MAG: polyribonucleotide nucleotidyltransferase [Candidatus Xenobiia bacterium LiM19]
MEEQVITLPQKTKVERLFAGKKLSLEAGHVARQANGSVVVRLEDTVVIVNATINERLREGVDFFPLTVDYEEKLYAAGKIPGGFIKREGRPSEKSILTSRLIDRPIRPLFPKGFRNEVQLIALVLSSDTQNDADIPAIIGASAALAISDIPFTEFIGAVRVGCIDGQYVINPTYAEREKCTLNIVVAGTRDNIMMVEAGAEEVSEDMVLEALQTGHEHIKEIISLIEELVRKIGKEKRKFALYEPDKDLEAIVRTHLTEKLNKAMRIADKATREEAIKDLKKETLMLIMEETTQDKRDALLAMIQDDKNPDFAAIIKTIEEELFKKMIVNEKIRPDGRKFEEIRPITCEVGFLPRTHGSGLFTRGQTQVLTILTLGMVSEEQILDGLGGDESKRYMHQYNFPPFSVGETKPMRGPGRREIGHGALAERAVVKMVPPEDQFPYSVRLVSEVLESNGSTSMASVCASTLALMDGGVKLKTPIAGVAMGLVKHGDSFAVLTDIQGMEDFLGDMDFKVAGSREGITALQMDIKIKGINLEIMKKALAQAKEGRLFILDKILQCIPEPRTELSPYAPRIFTLQISPDKIKDIIGPGGKMINKIIAETGVKIDIEDDGRIFIAALTPEAGDKAIQWIESIVREVEVGAIYLGKVTRLMNFGAFVEVLPGKEGLVHISQFSNQRVGRVEDVVNVGDELPVKVIEIDDQGRVNLTAKGLNDPASADDRPPRSQDGERRGSGRPPQRGGRPSGPPRDRGDRGGEHRKRD